MSSEKSEQASEVAMTDDQAILARLGRKDLLQVRDGVIPPTLALNGLTSSVA